jgi:hypothetical protein
MSAQRPGPAAPPPPPLLVRRVSAHPGQWVGLAGLVAIVAAGAAGFLSHSVTSARGQAPSFEVVVEYPHRLGHASRGVIAIEIHNRTDRGLAGVMVRIDPEYLDRFVEVAATPAFSRPFTIPLPPIPAGGVIRARVDARADRIWRASGRVVVTAARETVSLEVRTLILP